MPDYPESVFEAGNSIWQGAKSTVGSSLNYVKGVATNSVNSLSSLTTNTVPAPPPPRSTTERFIEVLYNNKYRIALSTALCVFSIRLTANSKPVYRRANKLSNGLRYEVILLIGSPNSPVVSKSISDLNARGFIVYVTVSNESELKSIENEKDPDIRPFFINFNNEQKSIKDEFIKFCEFMDEPTENDVHLLFKGAIFIPEWNKFPKGELEDMNTNEIQRVINNKCLNLLNVLNNGLFALLRASNQCKEDIEKYNRMKNPGKRLYTESGDAKLIIVNFIPIKDHFMTKKRNKKVVLDMVLGLQKDMYDKLYSKNKTYRPSSFGIFDFIGRNKITSSEASKYINMSMLNVTYYRNGNSSQMIDTFSIMGATNGNGNINEIQYSNESFLSDFIIRWKMMFRFIISKIKFSSDPISYYGVNRPFSSRVLNYKIFDLLYSKGDMGKVHYLSNKPSFF